jgi:light-regulated signal transduction histidine kinase (bacteriophytochrome)
MESTSKSLEAQLADALREQDELRRSLENCQLALAQAKREMDQSWEAAKLANEELQQFAYAASHDLQQPLRSIATYAQLLQREYSGDKQAAEFTSFIVDGTNQMGQLIRDLLTYSRTGSSVRRANIRLNAPLQWALVKLAEPIRETSASIVAGDLPEVYADEMQIAQVFDCVIGNAVKYRGQAKPEITVSAEEDAEGVTVCVKDNGEGIEPRFHDQVFVPFKRLHGRNIPGSGLGLAISRKIVRAHGGKIWVESDGHAGSTVKFTLPW